MRDDDDNGDTDGSGVTFSKEDLETFCGGFAIAQMSAVMFRCTVSAQSMACRSDWGPKPEWVRRMEKTVRSRQGKLSIWHFLNAATVLVELARRGRASACPVMRLQEGAIRAWTHRSSLETAYGCHKSLRPTLDSHCRLI